jgi:hypothetical protein
MPATEYVTVLIDDAAAAWVGSAAELAINN